MRHLPALDGLRAIAVSLVLWTHFWPDPQGWTALNRLANSGWMGVDLFFVLSGFLITRILVEGKHQPGYFRNFYARRALRIFPLYYAVLFLVLGLLPLVTTLPDQVMRDRWLYLAYLSNVALSVGGWQLFMLDITWSLAIEEQFYMVWPAIVRVVTRERLIALCLAIVIIVPMARLALWEPLGWRWLHMITPFRMDALAMGGLLALLPVSRRAAAVVFGVGLTALVALITTGSFQRDSMAVATFGYTLTAFTAAGALILAMDARWLQWAPLRGIGIVSYGVYLLHPICLAITSTAARSVGVNVKAVTGVPLLDPWIAVLIPAAVSVGVASVSYAIFERPFLRLKRYFVPSAPRSHPIAAEQAAGVSVG